MSTRREFGTALLALACHRIARANPDSVPPSALMEPAELAKDLQERAPSVPLIICVGFPILYRQRHVRGAVFAGPASKTDGISALQKTVAKTAKADPLVIYCGCCPMPQCPNVRPAYEALIKLGYKQVRVLNLPTNFHTDWVEKGYPTESAPAARQ